MTAKGIRARTVARALARSEAAGSELSAQFSWVSDWGGLNETPLASIELRNAERLQLEHAQRSAPEASNLHQECARDHGVDVNAMIGAAVGARHEADLPQGRLRPLDGRLRALQSLHELTQCCARSQHTGQSPLIRVWLRAIADQQCESAFPPLELNTVISRLAKMAYTKITSAPPAGGGS
jgi:hypothetical protein